MSASLYGLLNGPADVRDAGRLGSLMCVVPPEPKIVNSETGEVKTDRASGQTVYVVGVAVRQRTGRKASVIEISVPGEPKGVTEGTRVHVRDLEAFSWAMGDRHGLSFKAAAIAPADASLPAAPAPARPEPKGGPRGEG